jgi:hypothetical protein
MVAKIDRTGEETNNNFGSVMKIINYRTYSDIDVYFPEYDWVYYNTSYKEFKTGKIKCPYEPRVCGVGYIGEGQYNSRYNGIRAKSYDIWKNILERCYDKSKRYKHPSYEGCYVCEEWLNYQNFAYWYELNYYDCEGENVQIDKDILYKGNNVYSPDTCVFVPRSINVLFIKSDIVRGNLPIGVVAHNNKFEASCNSYGKSNYLGIYNTPEEAFYAYKEYKEKLIKDIADKYKDQIPYILYEAMYNYKVEIND